VGEVGDGTTIDAAIVESPAGSVPLCVDLDGTLIRSDMLVEGVLASITSAHLYRALFRLRDGSRAGFKRAIADAAEFDPALLPYQRSLVAYLQQQKAFGRRLILVTAADSKVARAVAAHLGLFDEVIASDGTRNLKGRYKGDILVERFGRNGFSYVGDSAADLQVWQFAHRGILVNAAGATARAARATTTIEREFNDRGSPWIALLRAMRPHQWVKNLLVFIPFLVSGPFFAAAGLDAALLAFLAFCATASGIYLLNDLADLAADRRHPRKRKRPFASGDVSLQTGLAAGLALVASGVALAASAGILAIVVLYAILSVSYSAKLKELPLVDVFMLGALYSIRLVGGGEATGHRVSLWLLAFSSFLFLSLALVKRVGELGAAALAGEGRVSRRGYQPTDIVILQMFGCSAAVAASLVLALFIQSEATAERYASPALLWGTVPLVLFWQCRVWLSTSRGYMHDDPIVYAARDWVSWLVALAAAALMVAAWPIRGAG
jgi:4-hydroxybenzoate polyprenyltransferase/phosphoserine phosphatase